MFYLLSLRPYLRLSAAAATASAGGAAAAAAAAAAVGCDAAAAGGPGTAAAAATGGLDRAQLFHHLLEFRLLLRLLLPVEGDLLAELARVGGRPRTRRRPWRRDRGRPAA